MALYEIKRNAENRIRIAPALAQAVVDGPDAVVAAIVAAIRQRQAAAGRRVAVACDGWYGVY